MSANEKMTLPKRKEELKGGRPTHLTELKGGGCYAALLCGHKGESNFHLDFDFGLEPRMDTD